MFKIKDYEDGIEYRGEFIEEKNVYKIHLEKMLLHYEKEKRDFKILFCMNIILLMYLVYVGYRAFKFFNYFGGFLIILVLVIGIKNFMKFYKIYKKMMNRKEEIKNELKGFEEEGKS